MNATPICIGPAPGFTCSQPPEKGGRRCFSCRTTHDVAVRLGRPVLLCDVCNEVVVLAPPLTTCLGCRAEAVFGDRAEAIISRKRDDLVERLLEQVDAGELQRAEAVQALAAFDATEEAAGKKSA